MIIQVIPRSFYSEAGVINRVYGVFIDGKLKFIAQDKEEIDSFIRGLRNGS